MLSPSFSNEWSILSQIFLSSHEKEVISRLSTPRRSFIKIHFLHRDVSKPGDSRWGNPVDSHRMNKRATDRTIDKQTHVRLIGRMEVTEGVQDKTSRYNSRRVEGMNTAVGKVGNSAIDHNSASVSTVCLLRKRPQNCVPLEISPCTQKVEPLGITRNISHDTLM